MRSIQNGMRKWGIETLPEDGIIELPWHPLLWKRLGETEPWAVVELRAELGPRQGTVWLRYDVDHISRPTGPQHYSVSMVSTPCRFGGVRWWWICPATGRRVRKLYLPNGGIRFLSRGRDAYLLAYASQRHGPVDRMHDRSRKLHRRLGADYERLEADFPPKPKGMHWKTYDVLCNRLATESAGLDYHLVGVVERLMRRQPSQ